jgi:hypothetical protein
MLGAQGLWAGRDLYRATPAVTGGDISANITNVDVSANNTKISTFLPISLRWRLIATRMLLNAVSWYSSVFVILCEITPRDYRIPWYSNPNVIQISQISNLKLKYRWERKYFGSVRVCVFPLHSICLQYLKHLSILNFHFNYFILTGWENLDKIYCRPLIGETKPKSVQEHKNDSHIARQLITFLNNIDCINFMRVQFTVD